MFFLEGDIWHHDGDQGADAVRAQSVAQLPVQPYSHRISPFVPYRANIAVHHQPIDNIVKSQSLLIRPTREAPWPGLPVWPIRKTPLTGPPDQAHQAVASSGAALLPFDTSGFFFTVRSTCKRDVVQVSSMLVNSVVYGNTCLLSSAILRWDRVLLFAEKSLAFTVRPWHCLLLPATVLNPINCQTNKISPAAAADTALVYCLPKWHY